MLPILKRLCLKFVINELLHFNWPCAIPFWNDISISNFNFYIPRFLFKISNQFEQDWCFLVIWFFCSFLGSSEMAGASLTKEVSDCFCKLLQQAKQCLTQIVTSIFPLRIFFSTNRIDINELYKSKNSTLYCCFWYWKKRGGGMHNQFKL